MAALDTDDSSLATPDDPDEIPPHQSVSSTAAPVESPYTFPKLDCATPSTASSPSPCSSVWTVPSTRPPSQATSQAPAPYERSVKAPSITDGEKHKFNLKDLLANGPKLVRKSSARSTASSKRSDSDGDRRSTTGDSVGSLSKYGVCQKVAIGKGATSVVRLAHKWDRTEEKLYAVKVRCRSPFFLCPILNVSAEISEETKE